MCIAPPAFTDATDKEVSKVSAITHDHRTSTDACIIFVELMRNVMNDALPSWALQLKSAPEQEIRSGGFVRGVLKAASWCFVNTSSYKDCVLAAVNLGDDTDTTAAVAGELVGGFSLLELLAQALGLLGTPPCSGRARPSGRRRSRRAPRWSARSSRPRCPLP